MPSHNTPDLERIAYYITVLRNGIHGFQDFLLGVKNASFLSITSVWRFGIDTIIIYYICVIVYYVFFVANKKLLLKIIRIFAKGKKKRDDTERVIIGQTDSLLNPSPRSSFFGPLRSLHFCVRNGYYPISLNLPEYNLKKSNRAS